MADLVRITISDVNGNVVFGPDGVDRSLTVRELKSYLVSDDGEVLFDNLFASSALLDDDETLEDVEPDTTLMATKNITEDQLLQISEECEDLPAPKLRDWEISWRETLSVGLNIGKDGQYKIVEELGSGYQATVYRCCHCDKGEEFAAKAFVKRKLEGDKEIHLRREVEALENLTHPRIVGIYTTFETDFHYFLIMDLVPGGDLLEYLVCSGETRIGESVGKYVFWQLLDGVTFMHSKKILHRDLKLENILLDDRTCFTVKIADFGLSKKVNVCEFQPTQWQAEDNASTTAPLQPLVPISLLRTTTEVGTPAYCAPEVVSGGSYDQGVDYWGLGICLYTMLCGVPPFGSGINGTSDASIDNKEKLKHGLFDKEEGWQQLPKPVQTMIEGLLQVDTDIRFGRSECFGHAWVTDGGDPVSFPMPTEPPWRSTVDVSNGKADLTTPKDPRTSKKRSVRFRTSWKVLKAQIPEEYHGIVGIDELHALVGSLTASVQSLHPNLLEIHTCRKANGGMQKLVCFTTRMSQASSYMKDTFLPDLYGYTDPSRARKALHDSNLRAWVRLMKASLSELITDYRGIVFDLDNSIERSSLQNVFDKTNSFRITERTTHSPEESTQEKHDSDGSLSPEHQLLDLMFLIPKLASQPDVDVAKVIAPSSPAMASGATSIGFTALAAANSGTNAISAATAVANALALSPEAREKGNVRTTSAAGHTVHRARSVAIRVVDILDGCLSFWSAVESNLTRTIELDCIEQAFELRSRNPLAGNRFEERFAECNRLWSCLRRACMSLPKLHSGGKRSKSEPPQSASAGR